MTSNKEEFYDATNERKQTEKYRPISREGVEKLRQFQDQLLRERGGVPFDDSTELIRQMREERTKELTGEE